MNVQFTIEGEKSKAKNLKMGTSLRMNNQICLKKSPSFSWVFPLFRYDIIYSPYDAKPQALKELTYLLSSAKLKSDSYWVKSSFCTHFSKASLNCFCYESVGICLFVVDSTMILRITIGQMMELKDLGKPPIRRCHPQQLKSRDVTGGEGTSSLH